MLVQLALVESPGKLERKNILSAPDGAHGTLFVRKPLLEAAPEWLNFVQGGLANNVNTSRWKNKSISALLVVEQASRQFAIAFGYGRHLIEPRLIEDRFGIRVVLNSVLPEKIASIDRQTFDASPRISRTQTIKAAAVSGYMINAEQDLLRGLVGYTKRDYSEVFGSVIAGIDSFKASIPMELSGLGKFLQLSLGRSISKDYLGRDAVGRPSEFSWVENLLPVKDKDLTRTLEEQLWESLNSTERKNMWLAIPDLIDWSGVTEFSYSSNFQDGEVDPILDLDRFLSTLRKGATLDTVKRREIFMIFSDGAPSKAFSAFRCLYAEVKTKVGLFILNVGSWFKVESSFQAAVEEYFTRLPRKSFAAPFVEYDHDGEGAYNEDVCARASGSLGMLDRKLVRFGGSYDKIEVCVIYKPKMDGGIGGFIHVKRGRGSSTLSHLFAQGFVASTLMVRESGFIRDINSQLQTQNIEPVHDPFEARGNDVVYAIVDGPASESLDIPFFGKVTLQNYGKTIASYGYQVKLMHIPESAAHLADVAKKVAEKAAKKKAAAAKSQKTSGKGKASSKRS
ncbi:TIGR04141 family sporadically distributed protein [Ectopseudomonas oleovorans]|uniref:Uncharacterized protein (TIGR04141 family) n=1 Tax=Ectopseudomonas oleovorans TaxID=301 RepID=A0A3D9ENE1_ECTOL|nr:TIGR04141 family sporadically distributed protein [Pseudomonas oleovorans]RED04693.1 uncharacterized protein (TIGR04141 family) [Pseudomonas oleovorans]